MDQGAKKIIFTAYHSGKLKLTFTSPDVISTSPKNFLTCRIDFTVLQLFEFLKKHHLPIRQVKNRIHQPNSKIQQPRAIRHYFLCMLWTPHYYRQFALSLGEKIKPFYTCTFSLNSTRLMWTPHSYGPSMAPSVSVLTGLDCTIQLL